MDSWWLESLADIRPRFPHQASQEEKSHIVKRVLLSSLSTWQVKRQLKEEVLRHTFAARPAESKAPLNLEALLVSSGLETKLKNSIYQIHRQAMNDYAAIPEGVNPILANCADKLEYVEKAKLKWERRIRLELDAMAAEMGIPLQRGKDEMHRHTHEQGEQAIRFVYDDNDLLDVLSNISNPNKAVSASRIPSMCLIKVELAVQDMEQLRETFKELDPTRRKAWSGADDDAERIRQLQRVVEQGFVGDIRQQSKRGIPASLRPAAWRKMLCAEVGEAERAYFYGILDSLREWELVTDELFRLDVSLMASDDDYFVFEDVLADCMAVFSRDPWVSQHAALPSQANDRHYSAQARQQLVFPPCGVVPFRGIVTHAAPLCYLYSDAPHLYYAFRSFYCAYSCRLNTVSSSGGSVVQLGRQLETLIQQACPDLVLHLVSIGAPPLRLALGWLFFAFAGTLEVDQVLAVWDLVLAWDSLVVLPLLAAAILAFRQPRLRQATRLEEAQHALTDCSRLKAVPLIQLFLYRHAVPTL